MTALRTERLILRPFTRADAPAIVALVGDPRVATMLADITLPFDEQSARLWLQPAWGDLRLGIDRDGELIGGVSYHVYSGAIGGIGYWLGHPFWGQGYASEAAGAVVRSGFARDRLQLFHSAHFVDNPASGRILTRLGFVPSSPNKWFWCPARQSKVETIGYYLRRDAAGFAPVGRTWAGWIGLHPLRNRWADA